MAMTCPQCGAEDVVDNSTFCHRCGERMDNISPSPAATATADPREGQISPVQHSEILGDRDVAPPSRSEAPRDGREALMTKYKRPQQQVQSTSDDDDEYDKIIWKARYAKAADAGWFLGALLLTVGLVWLSLYFQFWTAYWGYIVGFLAFCWIVALAKALLSRRYFYYELRPTLLMKERGFARFWTRIDRIELVDIRDLSVEKNFVEGLFGVGSITIYSNDETAKDRLTLHGVPDVVEKYKELERARHKQHVKRGVELL